MSLTTSALTNRIAAREYVSEGVATGSLSGNEMSFVLEGVPEDIYVLGAYIVIDGTPTSEGATNSLDCTIAGGNTFMSAVILGKTGALVLNSSTAILADDPLELTLEAKIGADDPGELGDIVGLNSIKVVLIYVPVRL